MPVQDKKPDESAPGGSLPGWGSRRDEFVAFWCRAPDYEADPGGFPGRMTVAPPLQVSTQAKRVCSRAPLAGSLKESLKERRMGAWGHGGMHVLSPRWCRLDIHNKTGAACVLLSEADGTIHRSVHPGGP